MEKTPSAAAATTGRVALACLLGGAALAQEPPTFRSGAQVVLLDVTARDSRGRPVEDLREDEIQVYEDGQRCEIASFRLVRAPGAAKPAPAAAASPAGLATPLADLTDTPSRANLVVLVFDTIPVANAALARQGALNLLSQRFPANTWFAVYKIDRSMRMVQPFTSDPSRLERAVLAATTGDDASRGGPQPSLQTLSDAPTSLTTTDPTRPDAPPVPNLGAVGSRVDTYLGELSSRRLAFDSLYGLLALARGLEPVRGRKSILYFAQASELASSVTHAYEATVGAANRAGVTIHTVDARGLSPMRVGGRSAFDEMIGSFSAQGGTRAADTGGRVVIPKAAGPVTVDLMADHGLTNPLQGSFLERVARDTGGLAIADTNDLGLGLARVVEELGQYYEVVYAPPRPEPDGRFRRIEATVSRKGVDLRTRSGYFATPAGAPTLGAYELPLLAALGASAAPHDFSHRAAVLHFGSKGRDRDALFLGEVDLASVTLADDPARGVFRARLAFLGFVKDDAGRAVARLGQDWPIEGPLAEKPKAPAAKATLRRSLTLPPGSYTLETAIEDRESGRLSVERSRFEIPNADGLAVGSLSVVRAADAAVGMDRVGPLRVSGVAISPHVGTPQLSAARKEVPLFLPVYPSLLATPPELRLELWSGGERVSSSSPALPPADADGRIPWIGGLSTKGLPPGTYEVVASVRQGEMTAEERATFVLGGGAGAADAASPPPAGVPPVPADIAPLLEKAARYVLEYETAFSDVVADESYTQWAAPENTPPTGLTISCAQSLCRRTTRADVVFVRLGGAIPWGCFRDVYEVDGQKVREPEGRLEAIFAGGSTESAAQRARRVLDESAKYNIGPATRNINFPTLALVFLHPANQKRFAWSRGGRRRIGSVDAVEVQFDEVARPTLVDRGGRGDLPAKGRFFVDPARGTVVRSEVTFRLEETIGGRARAWVAADYRPEPRLGLWVPSEMHEEYEDLPSSSTRVFGARSEGAARYAGFRRFSVTTDETGRVVDEPAGGGGGEPKPEEPRP